MGKAVEGIFHLPAEEAPAEQIVVERSTQGETQPVAVVAVKIQVVPPTGKQELPLPVCKLRQLCALLCLQASVLQRRKQRRNDKPLGLSEGIKKIQGFPGVSIRFFR